MGELNGLALKLQAECKPETCTQMTATEQWIFLCAAHKTPKECPAIDYTRHTLDGAACLLNSNKYSPAGSASRRAALPSLGLCVGGFTGYFHMLTFITDKFSTCLRMILTSAGG